MNRVRVKICGVRTAEEAEIAAEAGADALGFNFWPGSPRCVTVEAAREIRKRVSPLVTTVGVFVNEAPERVLDIIREVGLSAVQFHGDEPVEYCARFESIKTIKAIRVASDFNYEMIKLYPVDMVLLDAGLKGSYGGTGNAFDWSVAINAAKSGPIILAGGLRVDNVAEAVKTVRPYAVDVCSGVESMPGRKDPAKVRAFLREAAAANAALLDDADPHPAQIA